MAAGRRGGCRPSDEIHDALGGLRGQVSHRQDVVSLLDRISFTRGCALPAYLEVDQQAEPWKVTVWARARVPDRDDPDKRADVHVSADIRLPTTAKQAFFQVVQLLDRLWLHELRESVRVDGKLVLDPHAGEG